VPHHQDIANEAESTSTYECLVCGDIVKAESHPGACSECDGEYQNRAMSLE